MRLTKKYLNRLILEEISLMTEGEDADIFGGEEDTTDEEEPAEDEGGEEEPAEDEGGEEEPAEDEESTEGEEETTSAIPEPDLSELPPAERADLTKAIDDELNTLFIDFEGRALSSVAAQEESLEALAQESYGHKLRRYLFEGEEEAETPKIDVHQFATDTARLVNHYPDLLDMEKLIVNKAKYFLLAKYDQDILDEFEEILDTQHDISFGDDNLGEPFNDKGKPETPWPPRAVGAQPSAA
jgi:hypothetical protein